MDIIEIIGISGMVLILVFFFLNQIKKISQDSLIYDLGNLLGAGLLSLYAFQIDSIPFLILNLLWSFIALRDIIQGIRKFRKNN
ncbi:MAG: hypothetical protein KAT32_01475 [Candidatus Moranbacteria bacterium]|nr:hypothetical protein [Candidatus Moranbacteria bacterium]